MGSVSGAYTTGTRSLGKDKEKPHGDGRDPGQEKEATGNLTPGGGKGGGGDQIGRSKGRSLACPYPTTYPPP